MKILFLFLLLICNFAYADTYEYTIGNESIEIDIDSKFNKRQQRFIKTALDRLFEFPCMPSSRLHKHIFHGDSCGLTYLKWLRERIDRIEAGNYLDNRAFYYDYDGSIDEYFRNKSRTIYLIPNFFNYPKSTETKKQHYIKFLNAMSGILHEARHADGFKHVICPTSFGPYDPRDRMIHITFDLANRRSCDDNALSSHGTEIVFRFHRLANSPYFTPFDGVYFSNRMVSTNARIFLTQDLYPLLKTLTPVSTK